MPKKIYSLFLFLFLISYVSASLTLEPTNVVADKIYGEELNITLHLNNTESHNFTNLSFSDNDYIRMEEIPVILSGETKSFTATVFGDIDFVGSVDLEALFFSNNLGSVDEEYVVSLISDNSIDLRDFSIYVNNRVTFKNSKSEEVILVFGESTTTLAPGTNKTFTLTTAEKLSYYFSNGISSNPISSSYEITILPTTGIVMDPNLNPKVFLNISLSYPETTIQITYLTENNYSSLSPFESREGTIELKNTGAKIAKDINLNCEWMSFSQNNFDLSPGSSKPITYTFSPQIYSTNETNKSYEKLLTITGNFEDKLQTFFTDISYAKIGDDSYSQGSTLMEWFTSHCAENPDDEICGGKTVYIYQNESDNITIETGNAQFQDFISFIILSVQDLEKKSKAQGEIIAMINSTQAENNNLSKEVLSSTKESTNATKSINDTILTFFVLIVFVAIISLLFYILNLLKQQNKIPNLLANTWQKIKKQ